MTAPDWLKPGLVGTMIGAVVITIVGFSWGGWVTGGTAREQADTLAQETVTAAMVPVCLDLARSDPMRRSKIETIRDATRYRQRDALMEAGWATVPGAEEPDRNIARACLAELDLEAPAAREVDEG
ncbi:hypothetical protein ACX9MO_15390 [Pseudooceanicola sp. 502str34]